MEKFIRAVDSVIMGKLTKFAHWFQRLTGRTSIFLAKIGIVLVLVSSSIIIMSLVLPILPYKVSPLIAFILGIISIMEIKHMSELDTAEDTFFSSAGKVKHSWMRSDPIVRMMWLGFLILRSLELIFDKYPTNIWRVTVMMSAYLGLYFYYCFIDINPLPPCRSKLLNFIESFSLKPSIASSEK